MDVHPRNAIAAEIAQLYVIQNHLPISTYYNSCIAQLSGNIWYIYLLHLYLAQLLVISRNVPELH